MVTQSYDVVDGLFSHIGEEGIIRRVGCAAEDEVLPHQDPSLVGFAVERFVLVDAASPDTYHIHVGPGDMIEYFFVECIILL